MDMKLNEFPFSNVKLTDTELLEKRAANRKYMLKLKNENLLLSYKLEAGLLPDLDDPNDIHGGWESPLCQLRGHFLGHWLSAAAMMYAATNDMEVKAKADAIVDELGKCQKENGGEWAGSIPEKYLEWIAQGKAIWAPHYTVHKTLMGLMDMYKYAQNSKALDIVVNWAKWFTRWSSKFTREEFDNILDVETGGMLEIWADLYAITGDKEHKELINKYYRGRLFDSLLAGKDALTNMHANTTIPEILGAAKAYEVTKDQKWMDIVTAYWECAVTQRGYYCTGGQTCGEIWTPKQNLSSRLGDKNQEHCAVYNMMRLAEFLLRWTGEAKYADYWERNLYNGIMAQGYWKGSFTHGKKSEYPETGLLTYFLPLKAGSRKGWSSETNDFFCCHGSLVQANSTHNAGIYYQSKDGINICQYIPSVLNGSVNNVNVTIKQSIDTLSGSKHESSTSSGMQSVNDIPAKYPNNPKLLVVDYFISSESPVEFDLKIRIPWWIKGEATVVVNGERQNISTTPSTFITIRRVWNNDTVRIEIPKGITTCALPDNQDMVAFLDGPVVLAGLCDEDRILYGDKENPETFIIPDNEREWKNWMNTYRTYNQDRGMRFIPLYEVGYDQYSVYFQIKK